MNILSKLSISNLKLNKKRTISTIIGIILSVALICAVASMGISFQATLVENAINETGYYHLKIFDVTAENIESLKNNRDIQDVLTISEKGYGNLENSQNVDKPYLKLYSMDKNIFEFLKFNLIDGRFPANNNEIIISKHIIENAKVNYKIGDKIKVNIGVTTIELEKGIEVPVYDLERTICDIIRDKNKIDPQIFNIAMKEYGKKKKKNLRLLYKYSKEFSIENKLQQYMEVLVWMKNNTMSFKTIIKNIAKENKIAVQAVLQTYMLERLLERISISKYKDNFILKGGMLISAMLGIDSRTTMDILRMKCLL
mgnify:CR=1 FL=1